MLIVLIAKSQIFAKTNLVKMVLIRLVEIALNAVITVLLVLIQQYVLNVLEMPIYLKDNAL